MVTCSLTQFRQLQRRLLENIQDYDTPEFQALDSKAEATFEEILRTEPSTPADTQAMISFLLEMITNNGECGSRRIVERVHQLIGSLAAFAREPQLDLRFGAGI